VVQLLYFLRAALGGLRKNPFVHTVATLTLAVALFSSALARHGARASTTVLESWGGEVEVTFYLREGVTAEQAQALADELRAKEGGEPKVVTAEAALARLREELGDSVGVLEGLPTNPLPASVELRPKVNQRSAAALEALATRWSGRAEVEKVEYGREWIERFERLGNAAKGAGALVLLIVLVAAVVVVAATLQLAIYARREEIEIQKLVGATDSFVKAPLLVEGLFQGAFGGGLAALGLWGFSSYLGPRIGDALAFVVGGNLVWPRLIDGRGVAELCVAGMVLGLVGSFVAVSRFLRV